MAAIQRKLFGLVRPKIDLIIDVSNLAYRAAFRFKDLSHREQPTGHVYGGLTMLSALLRHYSEKSDCQLVFALDGKCQWRRDLLPQYKRNRGNRPSESSSVVEDVTKLCGWLPGLTILAPDDEADDVIAAHVAAYPTKQHVICSMDRDLWQLSSSHMVRVIRSSKEPPITPYQIEEDFHTRNPRLIPLTKALVGDPSDNIPGVKGFSRVDTKLLLAEMTAPSVDDLIAVTNRLDQQKLLKPRTIRLVRDNDQLIRQMLDVTTLRRSCRYAEHHNVPDRDSLSRMLFELACTSLLPRLDQLYGKVI